MRLKSLELNGFKTFATKTNFQFADEVTVIVGPNGSGKSNIADAVRWVLGEQSYKLLRGKKTLDMIFSGSDQRSRAGMASATITFDNSDGWLPIDFSEVTITRRAYRDGKNEYLINGQQVLLRDVYELLGQSGLAERTYTIIGQGLVDAVLSLKADERRSLFEEAAGIGLYRSRRVDAEKRLDKTHRNLDRVMDILSELEPRVKSLQRQAQRAEKYDQVKKDLRALLREWYGYHWFRVQEALRNAQEHEKKQRKILEQARERQAVLDRKLSENQTQVQSLRSKLNSWHRELSRFHSEREKITRQRAISDERLRSLELKKQELETERVQLESQLEMVTEKENQAKEHLNSAEESFQEANSKSNRIREALQHLVDRKGDLEQELEDYRTRLEQIKDQKLSLQVRVEERRQQIQRGKDRLQNARGLIQAAESDLAEKESQLEDSRQELESVRQQFNQVEKELRDRQTKIEQGKAHREELRENLSKLKSERSRIKAEIQVLKQAETKLVGYSSGAKVLLQERRQGKLSGVIGAFSNQLEVPERFELAVAAALGDNLDAVVIEKQQTADQALEMLFASTAGGVLIPLDRITPPERIQGNDQVSGLIGIAADLVKAPPRLRPAVDLLLGRVFILENKQDVGRVLRGQPPGSKAVTLKGEVFHATGEIAAGNQGQAGTLSRSRELKSWQEKLRTMGGEIEAQTDQLQKTDQALSRLEGELKDLEQELAERKNLLQGKEEEYQSALLSRNKAQQTLEWETDRSQDLTGETKNSQEDIARMQGEITRINEVIEQLRENIAEKSEQARAISLDEERNQLAFWEKETAVARRDLEDARERLADRQDIRNQTASEMERLEQQKQETIEAINQLTSGKSQLEEQEQESKQTIQELRELIGENEVVLAEKETLQQDVQKEEARSRKALNRAERFYAQAEINLSRRKDKLEAMQEKITEDIGLVELNYQDSVSGPTPLPLQGYVQKLPVVEEIPEHLGETLREQRAQLRRLGAINPEAQQEYQDVHQRHQFLTEQLSDLRKAEADIKEVIAELEVLMEREFRKTFHAVSAEFREIFTRLFGGGKGQLVLTDPDDLNLSGVDIEVKLPGRRRQGLSLLSGGERSLIAAALIFSLIKISPTPFCVLDEVDAMLDESNVARYRKLLRELSEETQFIVITHNRNTVEVADVIYGIIMSEDSSSQVLSLKLDQVDEVIES